MKKITHTIKTCVILGAIALSSHPLMAQEKVSSTNFARNTSNYENKEVILENQKVMQLYATRKPDGTIHNPNLKKSAYTGRIKGKSLPAPNCPYKKGYQEIRVDLGTKNYCFFMEESLNKVYTEELAKFQSTRLKYGIRAEMTIEGNVKNGFLVKHYKWKQ